MTAIEFLLIENARTDTFNAIAKLCQYLLKQDYSVHVLLTNECELTAFDHHLWQYSAESFFTHHHIKHNKFSRRQFSLSTELFSEIKQDVLINLKAEQPKQFSRYLRLIEIIHGDSQHRQLKRKQYRFYQTRGYPLTHRKL